MKDIHSKINPIVELFARGCSLNRIPHYYHGHSHHERGIDLTFEVCRITDKFFAELQSYFTNFWLRCDCGHVTIVIRLFEDNDLPF